MSLGGSNLNKGRIIRVKVTKEERKQRVMKTKQKKKKEGEIEIEKGRPTG
jgi:hypothetical protein